MSNEKDQKAKPSLLGQWKNRKQKTGATNEIITRSATDQLIPSAGQQRLWFLQQLYPDNAFYQYAHLYKITGKLDTDILTESFQLLVDRHEILRSNFKSENDSVVVTLRDQAILPSEIIDLTAVSDSQKKERADQLTNSFIQQTFSLEKDLLLRLLIIKITPTEHHLILSIHHIIGDRTSLLLINEEIFKHYKNLSQRKTAEHSVKKIQYLDYALWQQKQTTDPKDLSYWTKQLEGELPILTLPLDTPRPKISTYQGAIQTQKISPDLSKKIQALANQLTVTPYVLLLSAFKILLFRYTHQTDIIVGTPFSNRDKAVLEKLIGFFNETLAIRSQLPENQPFSQLVKNVKETTLAALAHKNMPFDELVKKLQPERHDQINPIFQAMFLYNNAAEISVDDLGLSIEDNSLDLGVSKFDLTLFVNEKKTHLETTIEYATDIFSATTIKRMLGHLENILTEVVKNPAISISKVSLLSETETNLITKKWNQTQQEMPAYQSIHQVITEMAKKNPNAPAVAFEKDQLTYEQLNIQANQIAQLLLENGAKKDQPIGLLADRSVEMIVGILGILKAGAAYLPLDPTYPAERINYMIEDAGVAILLSQDHLIKTIQKKEITTVGFKEARPITNENSVDLPTVNPEQIAYLIYTSGSTGQPKGVPISHKNLLHSTLARFSFYPKNLSAFLLLSSFSFDSSIVGIFWTLCAGGKLVLPPRRIEQDIALLSSLIKTHQISHTLLLPSLYGMVLDHATTDHLSSLRNVMVAGEACPISLVEKHFTKLPKTELYNEYGPTEASVWCIAHKISPSEKQYVPIGKAIPNTEIYILDKYRQPVPIGVSGEIYVGGPGLSKGYLERSELTASRFLAHPFKSDKMVYRTGDLARYHADGLIEFMGRVDQQAKIRGFRVEPEEIQKVMLESALVQEALVVVTEKKSGGPKQLAAYFTMSTAGDIAQITQFLEGRLPNYMVPALMISLDEFPRLPNGKINRKQLPEPTVSTRTNKQYTPPTTPLEITLAGIWESVLAIDSVGVHDNFFAIGGDSILSIQMVSKAKAAGISLRPTQLFEYQSVAALAKNIGEEELLSKTNESIQIAPIDNPMEAPLSYLQNAFLFNHQRSRDDQGQLYLEFEISGSLDFSTFQEAWADSSKRHDAMRAKIQTDSGQHPKQVITDEVNFDWKISDWSKNTETEKQKKLSELRTLEKNTPLNLAIAPTARMTLIKIKEEAYILSWVCHHIFLDGWSCGIILKDALHFYEGRRIGQPLTFTPTPNYPAFLAWQKKQDNLTAKAYWQKEMEDFSYPLLFKTKELENKTTPVYSDKTLFFSEVESKALRTYCQENEIALSALFQGLWALLLGNYFQTTDVVYGVTVSGRFTKYPEIDKISGLFMNILPNRFTVSQETSFADWLKKIQRTQGQKNKFDSFSFEEIKRAIDWPLHGELFHSLFIFGNFLKERLTIGSLTIEDFTGGFSSTYPLSIRVNPTAAIEINWRYDVNLVTESVIQYFKDNLQLLIKKLAEDRSALKIADLYKVMVTEIERTEVDLLTAPVPAVVLDPKNHVAPRNQTELKLVEIWKTLFGVPNVSIHDDYFELGGNSLLAIQLFAEIEKKMDIVLPPATLFQSATIAKIAKLADGDTETLPESTSLIPLRISGDKPPLFCLHGGGAHVFFYQSLAKNLPENQPVYTLQPPGLDGQGTRHRSIQEMAAHYVQEIQQVQPQGPYQILGTCFSNAVALEISNLLSAKGVSVEKLFIIDSAPVHLFGNDESGKKKTFSRFYDMLKRGDFHRIKDKVTRRFLSRPEKSVTIKKTESESEKNLRLTIDSLNNMYADYHWQPYDGKIIFIRSTEFHHRTDKKYHLTQWNKLAKKGIELHIVAGHHISLFEEPEVQGLADKIREILEV